jgi:hypothetical protein
MKKEIGIKKAVLETLLFFLKKITTNTNRIVVILTKIFSSGSVIKINAVKYSKTASGLSLSFWGKLEIDVLKMPIYKFIYLQK